MPDLDDALNGESSGGSLHGSAAAAVLLMLFDEDEAAQILSRLEPDEVRQLGYAMYDVADVEIEEVNTALDQFVNKAKRRTTIGLPPTSTMGLGRRWVSSEMRVPRPPARITAFIEALRPPPARRSATA